MIELITLLLVGVIASLANQTLISALGLEATFGFAVGFVAYGVCLIADYVWSRINSVETRRNLFGAPIWRAWIYAAVASVVLAPVAAGWGFPYRGAVVYLGALLLGGLIISVEVGVRNYLFDLKQSRQPKNWR